jgi:hypothetical protein
MRLRCTIHHYTTHINTIHYNTLLYVRAWQLWRWHRARAAVSRSPSDPPLTHWSKPSGAPVCHVCVLYVFMVMCMCVCVIKIVIMTVSVFVGWHISVPIYFISPEHTHKRTPLPLSLSHTSSLPFRTHTHSLSLSCTSSFILFTHTDTHDTLSHLLSDTHASCTLAHLVDGFRIGAQVKQPPHYVQMAPYSRLGQCREALLLVSLFYMWCDKIR